MWLVSHATPTSSSSSCVELSSPTHAGAAGTSSGRGGAGGSGATTPVRKISAHEFERGGLLKPIVNTIDGTPTFLSVSPGDMGQPGGSQVCSGNPNRPQRRSRHELRHLDEKDLIFELVGHPTSIEVACVLVPLAPLESHLRDFLISHTGERHLQRAGREIVVPQDPAEREHAPSRGSRLVVPRSGGEEWNRQLVLAESGGG